MKIQLGTFALLAVCLFAIVIAMGSCGGGEGEDDDDDNDEQVGVSFVSASPTSGSTLEPDATIVLTFDGTPTGVSVDKGIATVTGNTVTLSGPFQLGDLDLVVTWDDGRQPFTYTVNVETPEGMVLIPAGSFEMGGEDEEASDHEQPVHTVHLDAFYMDVYEVTNAQFKAFVDANPQWGRDNIEHKFQDGFYLDDWTGTDYPAGKADHPVTWVSWYAAMAYAEWAGKRLPTEAEWEYAARGGLAGKKYPWGDDEPTPADANYDYNVGDPTPVGQYPANGYGLYDMAGNMWEWCLDAYDNGFYAASDNSRNPIAGGETIQWLRENFTSTPTDSPRVLRGGSWVHSAQDLRVATRYGRMPTYSGDVIGFRCARETVTP